VVVYGFDKCVAAWASERLGRPVGGEWPRTIAIFRKGEIVAAVIYYDYRHPDIHASIASTTPAWATKDALAAIMRYPFIQLGCKRITAGTEASNHPAREFLCRLGFKQEGYHRDAAPNGDVVSYGLLRKDAARWLAEDRVSEKSSSLS
jgi:RimJ/RimL family protein N-acetyltransferase